MSDGPGVAGCPTQFCGPVDPCAEPWRKVMAKVDAVNAMTDIRERNKAISAAYAQLYLDSPDLKWAGAAAFASKQVGCGMDTARTYVDMHPEGMIGASRDMAQGGIYGAGVGPVTSTMYVARQMLGIGNSAVFNELYPPLRFYADNKGKMSPEQIMACLSRKPGLPVADELLLAFREQLDGRPNAAALRMLRHEQYKTLQDKVYDESWLFRRSLDFSKITGYPPILFVVESACKPTDPNRVVDFSNYPGRLHDADSRWPFARDCAAKFVELENDAGTRRALREIIDAAP